MKITINAQPLDWPKAIITEAQLRQYADAPTGTLWQKTPGAATRITGVANIYDGAVFYSTPGD